MCCLGILWQYKSRSALDALHQRNKLLHVLRQHIGWLVDELAARFIFTELVTNVAAHTSGPVAISLECDGESLLLKIADRGSGFTFDPKLPMDPFAVDGRGSFLVSHFASDVQIEKSDGRGTTIVAKLARSLAKVVI